MRSALILYAVVGPAFVVCPDRDQAGFEIRMAVIVGIAGHNSERRRRLPGHWILGTDPAFLARPTGTVTAQAGAVVHGFMDAHVHGERRGKQQLGAPIAIGIAWIQVLRAPRLPDLCAMGIAQTGAVTAAGKAGRHIQIML
jgi:hypothetical protein